MMQSKTSMLGNANFLMILVEDSSFKSQIQSIH